MRWVSLLWFALTFSLAPAQGHLAISRRYQSTLRVDFAPPPTPSAYRIQQLTRTHRHLEALAARLSFELHVLLAKEHHEQLHERNCKCESSGLTSISTPTPTPAQPAEYPLERNSSWRLQVPESSPSSGSIDNETSSRHQKGSFFTSTMFVLAVFFMAVPVACIIGFVVLCKRRRRQQHTHV